MADPLSIASSIAGLVTLADVVFDRLCKYTRAVKNADKEIEALKKEVNLLGGVLNSLSRLARSFQNEPFDLGYRMHHVDACDKILSDISRKLKKVDETDSIWKFRWPFSSTRVKEMLDDLAGHKQCINLALSANSMEILLQSLDLQRDIAQSTTEIRMDIKKTREITSRIHDSSQNQAIIAMFLKCNPQTNYEMSLKLRHPRTGMWLMRLPAFQTWLSSPGGKLWFYGIPGAGKTVLAGCIIEAALSTSSEKVAVAFFFCDYKDDKTHLPVNILSALAYQLAIQNPEAYEILSRYHAELKPNNRLSGSPSESRLENIILEMADVYDRLLVIVDGLDECGKGTNDVLICLLSVCDNSEKISVAFLSRDELNIREVLEDEFKNEPISAHKEDIVEYVTAEIEERTRTRKLHIGDASLKGEILDRLVEGAKGMFRWVACQLDHLCDCISDEQCREALGRLPPDLNETYLRILRRVPQTQVALVQMTLLFTAYASPALNIRQLREALSVTRVGEFLREDGSSLIHEQAIQKYCSSLIRKSNNGDGFEFAHFSVEEFLKNELVLTNELSPFLISQSRCNRLLAAQCLKFLQLKNFDKLPITPRDIIEKLQERNRKYMFYGYASTNWATCARAEWHGQAVFELAERLFRRQKTPVFVSWSADLLLRNMVTKYNAEDSQLVEHVPPDTENGGYGSDDETIDYTNDYSNQDRNTPYPYPRVQNMIINLYDRSFSPLHFASILSLPEICSSLIRQGVDVNSRSQVGTAVQCAVRQFGVFGKRLRYTETRQNVGSYAVETVRVLKEASAQLLRTRPTCSGPASLISDAILLSVLQLDFSMVTFLLLNTPKPLEQDVNMFSRIERVMNKTDNNPRAEQSLQNLVETLGSLIDTSSCHRQMCERAWEIAISTNCEFALDPDIIDSTISYTADRLQMEVISAVEMMNLGALKRLIRDSRLNVAEIVDSIGMSLLHIAMKSFLSNDRLPIIRILLMAGCQPTRLDSKGRLPSYYWFPHPADGDQTNHLIKILVGHGMTAKSQDSDGWNELHLSVTKLALLEALLRHDTEANIACALRATNNSGYTPFSLALSQGIPKSAALLFERGGLDIATLQSPTPVALLAVRANREYIFRTFEEAGMNVGFTKAGALTPLHYLAYDTSLDFINYLKSIYKDACELRIEGKLPVDIYIEQCLEHRVDPDTDIIVALVRPLLAEPTGEKAASVWKSFCTTISQLDPIIELNRYIIDSPIEELIRLGVVQLYEAVYKQCAVLHLLETASRHLENGRNLGPISPGIIRVMIDHISDWATISTSSLGARLLLMMTRWGSVELTTLLLQKGVDVHCRVGVGLLSLLETACQESCGEEMFQLLLDHADPERLNETNSQDRGLGLIHRLAFVDVTPRINALLKRGADRNLRTSCDGRIPALVFRIQEGDLESATALLEAGADPTLGDDSGLDAALSAAWYGQKSLLLQLREMEALPQPWKINWQATANINFEGPSCSLGALHLASDGGHLDCLRFYMDNGLLHDLDVTSTRMHTPLHLAALRGHLDIVEFLLKRGANINARTGKQKLPLHYAVRGRNFDTVKLLIDSGSEDTPDNTGMRPSTLAFQIGNSQMVEYFEKAMNMRVSFTSLNEKHFATLFEAAILAGDLTKCKELYLRGCSLNIDLNECSGCSPLLLSIRCHKVPIIRWLLDNGALTLKVQCGRHGAGSAINNILGHTDLTGALQTFLDKYLSDGGSILDEWPNPVCTAPAFGNVLGLRILLDHIRRNQGCYASFANRTDNTNTLVMAVNCCANVREKPPLIVAVARGNYELVRILLENGADPNLLNRGQGPPTPLHFAISHLDKQALMITELLIKHGAAVESRDSNGRTPLLNACLRNRWDLVDILIHAGASVQSLHWNFGNALDGSGPAAFSKLLNLNLDPYTKIKDGFSPILNAMQCDNFQGLILNGDFYFEKIGPFPWISAWNNRLSSTIVLFRRLSRRVSRAQIQYIGSFEPQDSWSPLCRAAATGMLAVLDDLLALGAKLEFEGCPEGTALMSACRTGRLDSVMFLVRRGAALSYHGPNGFRSALDESKTPKRILHWLLVRRFTDQKKLGYEVWENQHEPISIQPWGGTVQAELVICGDLERSSDESSKDYWIRLMRVKRDWRGKNVPPQARRKTTRPSKLVPQEPVRIHPKGYNNRETNATFA